MGCVDAAGLAIPYFWDDKGNPHFIVAKVGQETDLTFGRFSELEAYTCYETYPDKSYTVRLSLSSLRGPLFLTLYTLQQFVGAPVSTPVFRYIAPGELFIRRLGGGPVGAGFQGSVLVPPVPPRKLTLSGFEPNCTPCLSRDGIIILPRLVLDSCGGSNRRVGVYVDPFHPESHPHSVEDSRTRSLLAQVAGWIAIDDFRHYGRFS